MSNFQEIQDGGKLLQLVQSEYSSPIFVESLQEIYWVARKPTARVSEYSSKRCGRNEQDLIAQVEF